VGRGDTQASPSWTDTRSLDLVRYPATAAGEKGTDLETLLAKERKEKFTRMHRNGIESKIVHDLNEAKEKAKAKERERKAGWATGTPNPFVTIGARGMGTAVMQLLVTSRTMVRKEVRKEKEKKGQRRYRPMP
jgi:hypothetical protein